MKIAKPTVAKPTNNEIRAPWTTRLNSSRTLLSAPLTCSGRGAGRRRRGRPRGEPAERVADFAARAHHGLRPGRGAAQQVDARRLRLVDPARVDVRGNH